MNARKSSLLISIVAVVVAWGGHALAQVPTLPPDGGSRLSSPTCATSDEQGRAAFEFRAGAALVMRGTTFPANGLILVKFLQDPLAVELGRFKANAAGDFTTEPTLVQLPTEAKAGRAVVQASSEGGSANCEIRMLAVSAAAGVTRDVASEGDKTNALFVVWATLLALGGGFLTFVAYRRKQDARLEEAMTGIAGNDGGKNDDPRDRRGVKRGPPRLRELFLPDPPRSGGERDPYGPPPLLPEDWAKK